MTSDATRALLAAAAWGYAGSAAFSSWVAVRDDIPGEPLGISVPLSVRTGVIVGWGAGIAPPWYLPVAALVAVRAAGGRPPRAGGAAAASAIGLTQIVGHLIEPVTRRPATWTPATATAITLSLSSAAVLTAAGLAHYRSVRRAAAGSPGDA